MRKELESFKKAFGIYMDGLMEQKRLSKDELSQFLNMDYQNYEKAKSEFKKFKKFIKDADFLVNDVDKATLKALRMILEGCKIVEDYEDLRMENK